MRFWMRYTAFLFFSFLFISTLLTPKKVVAQTGLSVSNIQTNLADYTQGVPKYEKFEISFDVTGSSASNFYMPFDSSPPAGVDSGVGITVNALFLPPGQNDWNNAYVQPAFYFQEFTSETRNGRDWIYPTGNYLWKVRFAPNTEGVWQYRLTVTDSQGSVQSETFDFEVVSSENKGFIKVSQDPRYFEYEDGTYFPGLGYNVRPEIGYIDGNTSHFQTMSANGIQLARMWLSSWSIFGSSWNPWNAMPQDYDGYIPRPGLEAYEGDFRLKMIYRASNPNQPSCTDNCSYWKATRFIGWMSPQPAVKPNTNYRVRVRYQGQNIQGPRNTSFQSHGLVVKIGGWVPDAHQPGTGTVVSEYGGNTDTWSEIEGFWNSGNNNFLPNLYITLENVIDPGPGNPAATVYVDEVWVEEDLGGGSFGPNIIYKPSMKHHKYFDQRSSFAFDNLVLLAEEYGIYLRPVILEKDEYIQNHIDFQGNLRTDDIANLFYGDGANETAVRWYQKAWWRYLQARWGYSTNIHSWELINEGNPTLTNHYILADQLGQYMRQFAPNSHLVSTSNWHSFPANLWSTYQNIDYADVHYYQPRSAVDELYDTSLATFNRSMSYGALRPGGAGKPVIRGETGFVESGSGPSIRDLDQDVDGIWLHKFLWGQLNSGGMLESYWYTGGVDGHIFNAQTGNDHRDEYGNFYRFIKDLPLSNGNYEDASAVSSNTSIRAWGQKDLVEGRAHVWVNNINHTWKNVVDGVNIAPQSATITISGFSPNTNFNLEYWDTYSGSILSTGQVTSNPSGEITLNISGLNTDSAYRIGDYSVPTGTPTLSPGDANGDGKVDGVDYVVWLIHYGQDTANGYEDGDFNASGAVDGVDYVIWLTNYSG